MNRTCRSIAMVTLATMFLGVLIAVPFQSDGAGVEYEQEISCYYYSVGMSWTGQEAETVTWDFGDGSEPETGFIVSHRYAAIGDYTVTVIGTNPLGSDVKHYLIHILGYPVVSFESNGGSSVASIQMESGGNSAVAAVQPVDPVREGYTFAGWCTDPGLTNAYDWNKPVIASMTLYAKWNDNSLPTVTVTFDSDGGSSVVSQVINQGGKVAKPADPVKEGYVFAGWFFTYNGNDVEFTFGEAVNSDLTLKAHWTVAPPEDPSDNPGKDSGEGSDLFGMVSYVAIVLGIVLALAALLTGAFILGIPAVICIVLGILLSLKVITL